MPVLSGHLRSDVQDEYYRREVMTRTTITRSTEALSLQPPLGRSSPIQTYSYVNYLNPNTREEKTVDYKVTHHYDIEEEERRIREQQDRRRREEDERRRREEESRRAWELREQEVLERLRVDRERKQKDRELSVLEREKMEKERIEKGRLERERLEMQRRAEWERLENERRGLEEEELARKRQLEKERLQRERAEEEKKERERIEREREHLERLRLEEERREQERLEKERIERERIERERIEIERIERIKRERVDKERREREKERKEMERLQKEREELERLEKERRELELKERELLEIQQMEAIEREKQRLEDEAREARRREEERREADLLADIQRQVEERERLRRAQEREEKERIERIRREQQRVEMERSEAERRERERLEDERREKELLEVQFRKKEQRERERMEDLERENALQEEEMRERARREKERRAAAERERMRREEEEKERLGMYELERAAANRKLQRQVDLEKERQREELDRKAIEIAELERKANERREMERLEEERSLAELKEKERRNQEIRDRERKEAEERAAARQREERRSRDKLDMIVQERSVKERFEQEKRRLLAEKEALSNKSHFLTSSETLQKLAKPLYISRETLSNPDFTTKIERQMIERMDRNVWIDDVRNPSQQTISCSLNSTNEENVRDRMYNPNDLSRNGSSRTSRYRAKMEKARREFIVGGPETIDSVSDRFRRSQEEMAVRLRRNYRGPLLQRFHDSEFEAKTDVDCFSYPRVEPSPYAQEFERLLEETERRYSAYRMRMSQPNLYSRSRCWSTNYLETDVDTGKPELAYMTREVEETNLDDVHRRSGSLVDYNHQSRRDRTEDVPDTTHIRSRSADYLMDRRTREESAPPENELQKTVTDLSSRASNVGEHGLRFRKSTEKLTVPNWYLENTSNRSFAKSTDFPQQAVNTTSTRTTSVASTGIDFPKGMFDRYKDEIEDMRRSRSFLHQLKDQRQVSAFILSDEVKQQALPGYTVSNVPNEWIVVDSSRMSYFNGNARVIEVADTGCGLAQSIGGSADANRGGRLTVEEALDSIFQQAIPPTVIGPGVSVAEVDIPRSNKSCRGIYSGNRIIMEQVLKQPSKAKSLLKLEQLFVRCSYCHKTRELTFARTQYVTCKHCYTYYCSKVCRLKHWEKHSGNCSFARINTLCKDVIMKVRRDALAQASMSRLARVSYASKGRGSVNIRLPSPQIAQAYVNYGWDALSAIPLGQLLHYYTIAELIREQKEPSLITLCCRYDPKRKFILSVSIIADIENCPQTPPPEATEVCVPPQGYPLTHKRASSTPDLFGPLALVPTVV